jgi:acyl dehydratase
MKTLDRWYEDIEVDEVRETGDFFPHHMDAQWMATQPAGQRIAHGTLILSVAVGMTADDINPQAMSYGYDRIRFIRPVFIGDTIHVTARIAEKMPHAKQPEKFGYVHELVTVTNQSDETVMVLTHLYLVNRRA